MRERRAPNPQKRGQSEGSSAIAVMSFVSSKAALALAGTSTPTFLNVSGAYGIWVFDGGNHAADVTGDPTQTSFIAIASDPTGAAGAWVKVVS